MDSIKTAIESGDLAELDRLLTLNPNLANKKIQWESNTEVKSDPLHYISDCIFYKLLTNDTEAQLAKTLIKYGALINGSEDSETPLIGAASLGAASVAKVLIDAGADIHATSVHGSTALHWSCYMGLSEIAEALIHHGAEIEKRCSSFESTPLFWAVHSIHTDKDKDPAGRLASAKVLIENGANKRTENHEGYSVFQLAKASGNLEIIKLLEPDN